MGLCCRVDLCFLGTERIWVGRVDDNGSRFGAHSRSARQRYAEAADVFLWQQGGCGCQKPISGHGFSPCLCGSGCAVVEAVCQRERNGCGTAGDHGAQSNEKSPNDNLRKSLGDRDLNGSGARIRTADTRIMIPHVLLFHNN